MAVKRRGKKGSVEEKTATGRGDDAGDGAPKLGRGRGAKGRGRGGSCTSDTKYPAARAPAATPEERQGRISHIVLLMVQNEWQRGASEKELAVEWGLEKGTVHQMAAEASRYLDLAKDDRGQLEGFIRAQLVDIAKQGGNDRVNALRTLLENKGLLRQKRETVHKYDDKPVGEIMRDGLEELMASPEGREMVRERLTKGEN